MPVTVPLIKGLSAYTKSDGEVLPAGALLAGALYRGALDLFQNLPHFANGFEGRDGKGRVVLQAALDLTTFRGIRVQTHCLGSLQQISPMAR
ncbi:MAG: hypothetical protein M3360_01120 [Actinomycetota bacterium]|nr:hypothetical protein [Actinomycetota bacterium]